jgi:hypothetical protein
MGKADTDRWTYELGKANGRMVWNMIAWNEITDFVLNI